jgi:hypothetical protein
MAEYIDAFQRAINNQTRPGSTSTPTISQTPDLTPTEERLFGVKNKPAGTGTGTGTGTNGLLPGETVSGNQLLLNGKPFGGMKNGILFINGYRQDQYNPDGTDRITPTAVPGSTGLAVGATRTLARDTFANTFALIFGSKEASQPYVGKLYDLVSGFYKTGSTIEDALNLAIRQAREEKVIPEFTKRFAGIFALDDQFKAGKAISVPTIAEFFAAEAKMGEVLTNAGLGDLATQEFLGNVIGLGKSVLEVGNLISNTFSTIDDAPASLKADFATYFPGVDRVSIARALLTGPEGAAELDKRIKGISTLSAARSQGITTDLTTASDIAAQGYDYQQSLTGFGTVNQLQRANTLAEFGGGKFTQTQAISATFGKSIEEKKRLEQLDALERARYAGRSGVGQNTLGANTKGAGLI